MSREIIVTGASSGIGLACARRALARGEHVVAQYRTQPGPVGDMERQWPDLVTPVAADLGTEAGCREVVAAARRPAALVHSAGVWAEAPIRDIELPEVEWMLRVNTISAILLARECAAAMTDGVMVFIGSTAGQRGEPGSSHYAASKAALWGLVQSLAQELAPSIRVNLVSPGWVRTPMAADALARDDREARVVDGVPLHRIAEADDVAAAVEFLSDSERARHLTGVDLAVSGGALLPLPRG